MAVLIDPPGWPAHGRLWSHLASDTSLDELHAFARRAGLPERGFEGDHYDVPEERYVALIAAGAVPVTGRDLVRRLQRSGLRRPKRRGERVLASFAETPPNRRVDTVLSALPPPGPVRVVQLLAVAGPHLLVLPDGATGTEGCLVPTAPVAPGEDPVAVLAGLGVQILGPAWRYGGPTVQVGYLRHVTGSGLAATDAEVVLRWRWPGLVSPPVPAPPAVWADAGHAAALLPVAVAPLVRPSR
ncbi:MAG TPA: DUF4031 domain-containing protein [Kineosporiaceae bacterium]|nr:DUF4031 domain-containing protein [Kineosporiaceae bacterium]